MYKKHKQLRWRDHTEDQAGNRSTVQVKAPKQATASNTHSGRDQRQT